MTEIQYVWEHWKFNADQRIKAFNFFVIFAIFADGGVFAALERGAHPVVFLSIGILIVALSAAFCVIDVRSEQLIRLSEPGLLAFEGSLGEVSRVFHADAAQRRSWVRYRYAIRGLILIQALFGVAVTAFGVMASKGTVARDVFGARPIATAPAAVPVGPGEAPLPARSQPVKTSR
jgi:hypothetical protein